MASKIKQLLQYLTKINKKGVKAIIITGSYAIYKQLFDNNSDLDITIFIDHEPTPETAINFFREHMLEPRMPPIETKKLVKRQDGSLFFYHHIWEGTILDGIRVDFIFRSLDNAEKMLSEIGSPEFEQESHNLFYSEIIYQEKGCIASLKKKCRLSKKHQMNYLSRLMSVENFYGLGQEMRQFSKYMQRDNPVQCLHHFDRCVQHLIKMVFIANNHPLHSTGSWKELIKDCEIKPKAFESKIDRMIIQGTFSQKYQWLIDLIEEFVSICGERYGMHFEKTLRKDLPWLHIRYFREEAA